MVGREKKTNREEKEKIETMIERDGGKGGKRREKEKERKGERYPKRKRER